MNEVIIYLIKVIVIHGLLYLVYRLFLSKSTKHTFNRMYLLCALILAFVIPFIELPMPQEKIILAEETPIIFWLSEPSQTIEEFELIPISNESVFSWWSLLPWAIGLVAFILLARSIVYLFILQKLKKQSEPIKKRWFTLFRTSHSRPFSFLKSVFIPRVLFGSDAFNQVLAHECVHVRQLHSIDRLLLDFVVSLLWFNPFIYLYRNALIEIHEYQADEAVVKRFDDPIGYQEILFSQLKSPQYSGLVSHFNVEMIKKRIVMMNKPKKRTGWMYTIILPVMLMIVFAFSSKEVMNPINKVGNELSGLIGPVSDVKLYSEMFFHEDDKPTISPMKSSDIKRLTSGFGMRLHPVFKEKHFHRGVDFSSPIGSPVMATASGKVAKISDEKGGYGKMIVLDHGNGIQTRYAHLSEFKVTLNEEVVKGQEIALTGNSGASTKSHLHYEVIKEGKPVDPKTYIKDLDFALALAEPAQDYTPSIAPVKEQDLTRLTSRFGMREHPIYKVEKMHYGVDFSCPVGTSIVATADGVVKKVQTKFDGYGKLLVISHGDQFETRYGQLSEFKVEEGDKVTKGQVVALSGNSGASTGPHLHYEVLKDGKRVNPLSYISNYKFQLNEVPSANEEHSHEENDSGAMQEHVRDEELELSETELDEDAAKREEKESYEMEQMKELEREKALVINFIGVNRDKNSAKIILSGMEGEPLIILDGREVGQEWLALLGPEDTKSVTVLKLEKDTKKYGPKGKNGVVLIETRPYRNKSVAYLYKGELFYDFNFDQIEEDKAEIAMISSDYLEVELPDRIKSVYVINDPETAEKASIKASKEGKNWDGSSKDKYKIKNPKEKAKTKSKTKEKDKSNGLGYSRDELIQTQSSIIASEKDVYRVIIDPGHGGNDHGATSPSGASEKEISLAIAKMIQEMFDEEKQIEIVLTREEDNFLELTNRYRKSQDADLFISLHTDNYSEKGSFIFPIYHQGNKHTEQSKQLAMILASEFEECGKEATVGYSSGYAVLKNADCPAVLLNVGWFSDPVEDEYLSSKIGKQEVATQISDAIKLAVL